MDRKVIIMNNGFSQIEHFSELIPKLLGNLGFICFNKTLKNSTRKSNKILLHFKTRILQQE
jgi:hypothetical protein